MKTTATQQQREFNATAAGQRTMCNDATSRAVVIILNRKVRSLGGAAWDDKMIESANDSTLRSISDDLITIYNALVKSN